MSSSLDAGLAQKSPVKSIAPLGTEGISTHGKRSGAKTKELAFAELPLGMGIYSISQSGGGSGGDPPPDPSGPLGGPSGGPLGGPSGTPNPPPNPNPAPNPSGGGGGGGTPRCPLLAAAAATFVVEAVGMLTGAKFDVCPPGRAWGFGFGFATGFGFDV